MSGRRVIHISFDDSESGEEKFAASLVPICVIPGSHQSQRKETVIQFKLQANEKRPMEYHIKLTEGLEVEILDEPERIVAGDVLELKFYGVGLFKLQLMDFRTRENLFENGYAIADQQFTKEYQKIYLKSIPRVGGDPGIFVTVQKVNEAGKIQPRTLHISGEGLANYRDSGVCSSLTEWDTISSAIDFGEEVHICLEDGKKRVYQTPVSAFLTKCLLQFFQKEQRRLKRAQCFGSH